MVKMKMKMCVLFVILALVSQHASAVEMEVYKGEESVLLPCQFAAPISKDHVIVWRRDDLGSPIIHSIVDGNFDLSSQNKRYTHRTSMRADALQTGDISLTLRNPTFTDSGTYTCLTRKDGEDKQRTEVQLKVTERPVWHKVLPAVLVPVLLLSAVIAFLLYRVKEKQNSMAVGQLTGVEVMEGAASVLLPYKPTLSLPEGLGVEWIFVTDKNNKIFVFENGEIKHDQQHEDYRERAVMESYPPKKKKETDQLNQPEVDLSLTLKKPVCKDGGVYLCIIYDKDGKPVTLKVVTLLVKGPMSMSIRALWETRKISKSYNEISLLQQERRLSRALKKCRVV